MNKNVLKYLFIFFAFILGFYLVYQAYTSRLDVYEKPSLFITEEALKPEWIENRMKTQKVEALNYKAFHDFSFSDEIRKSNISFHHLINPDGNVNHKSVHYDHGNGLTVADVDNDGRYDIYFVSQVGKGELWRNIGDGRFENITAGSGLEVTGKVSCVSASFGDIDNDGDPDLYVSVIRDGNFLFENQGDGTFKNISQSAKVNYHGHSSGICYLDYDLDGLLDIFITNVGVYTTAEKASFVAGGQTHEYYVGVKDGFAGHLKPERFESNILYKNQGNNTFQNVSAAMGIRDSTWCGDAVSIDGNNDGFPDIYITNMQGHDDYYENKKGKGFVKKGRELFPKTSWGAMGIAVFDMDNDGLQDIYITDMHSDMGANVSLGLEEEKLKKTAFPESFLQTGGNHISGNSFFKKTGKNQYSEISDDINAENYWPWGLSSGDLNADGYVDVFVCKSMNFQFRYTENLILLNESGQRFLDSEYLLGAEPRRGKRYAKLWFELDCDGKDSKHQYCLNKNGKQAIWGALGTRSAAIFDLDDDGDLDIVTNEFFDNPMVLISNLSDKKTVHSLRIKLEGIQSNRDGLGAVVTVVTASGTQTKVHYGKSGYLAHSSLPLYFGLGDQGTIESLKVQWPSGVVQVIPGNKLLLNKLNVITEKG